MHPSARIAKASLALVGAAAVAFGAAATAGAAASAPVKTVSTLPGHGLAVKPNTFSEPGTFVDDETGRCLDSNGSGAAYALPCNGGAYQKWYVSYDGSGDLIEDEQTGLCLAVTHEVNSGLYSVGTESCDGSNAYQNWAYSQLSSNLEEWVNFEVGGSFALDSNTDGNGNNVGAIYLDPWNGGAFQKWNYA